MKITTKLYRAALALLFVVAFATTQASAQKIAEAKTVSPSSSASTQASPLPSPLPVKPVEDKLAPSRWTRYEIGEPARFSLILPSEPASRVERSNILPGVPGISQSYLSVADSGVYGLSYVEALPDALRNEARRKTFFDGFAREFAEGFQARMKERGTDVRLTMLEQRTATVSGLAGYEQDFSYGTVMGRVRLVFGRGSAYAVMAIWNGLSSNSERNAFFESLKVNEKR